MKQIEKPQKSLAMGRRDFLGGAAALGVGAGLSAPVIVSRAAATETSVISLREQDLPFIATEETYTTDELMALNVINDDHREFLEETGLAELAPSRCSHLLSLSGQNTRHFISERSALSRQPFHLTESCLEPTSCRCCYRLECDVRFGGATLAIVLTKRSADRCDIRQ